MGVGRIFYLTQESLSVYRASGNEITEAYSFNSTDAGFGEFDKYLETDFQERSLLLVDVIEEEIVEDSVPRLSRADRKGLIDRRLSKRFPRTAYRVGRQQARKSQSDGSRHVLFAAITNVELIDPWLDLLQKHKTPLTGLYSVPLMGAEMLQAFHKPEENSLLISRHQGGRLRQVFLKNGFPVSARLSRPHSRRSDSPGKTIHAEIEQSRKYFERSRMLNPAESLHIYLITDKAADRDSLPAMDANDKVTFHVIESDTVLDEYGFRSTDLHAHAELLYVARCFRRKPRLGYPLYGRTDYNQHALARNLAASIATVIAVACSVASGMFLAGAYTSGKSADLIQAQMTHLYENYRREHDEFEPIQANSHEMKLAVDTGDYILRNTLPVGWVMRQISGVMEEYPDVYINQLRWHVDSGIESEPGTTLRAGQQQPTQLPITGISAVQVEMVAELSSYSGDLRQAFDRIDTFANRLKENTAFDRIAISHYPIDAAVSSSVSGEVRKKGNDQAARFSLQLELEIGNDAG